MAVTIKSHRRQIESALDEIYQISQGKWITHTKGEEVSWVLDNALIKTLDEFWSKATDNNSTTIVTNLTTCLVSKAVESNTDVRYHRPPKKGMPAPPNGGENYFSGRTLSEKIVAPWLHAQKFFTAASGWQTRTFERPRPYTLDYPENIGYGKDEFLSILDKIQASTKVNVTKEALSFLIFKQIQFREGQKFELTVPNIKDIQVIVSFFDSHMKAAYSQRGASRLPVLGIYSIYNCILPELERYKGKRLAPLKKHQAADSRTGAAGDIEIHNSDGSIFEALEIKHDIAIDSLIIEAAYNKFHSIPLTQALLHLNNCRSMWWARQRLQRVDRTDQEESWRRSNRQWCDFNDKVLPAAHGKSRRCVPEIH